jgi:hypothetical protein
LEAKYLGSKFMKKELNYLASKKWEELRSTPYKQEIDPRCFCNCTKMFPEQRANFNVTVG